MKRIRRFFGLAVVGCLVLAGWALSTGGVFDGPIAKELRGSSVYVAPDVGLDERMAERVIGNRKLTVAFMPPGTELSEVCDDVGGAADGTLLVPISQADDEYDVYPCAGFTDDFGEAMVSGLRAGSWVRTAPTGADGLGVRGSAWHHHPPPGGRPVCHLAGAGRSVAQTARASRQASAPRGAKVELLRTPGVIDVVPRTADTATGTANTAT